MIKKMLSAALMLVASLGVSAQVQQLPLNADVKHGTLPNGLQYFILRNELPKERANFYIAQKVGSTLETPEQLGLAHFLEHMAFNGTTNYPGKNMLNYLQSKGIRFGADINAYTDFDETVYNIDNVNTKDAALMDSVLLAIHDWSCEILLEEDEINAERGVIEEEWRSRNNAQSRMIEAVLPQIYEEYNYQQTPIGKMEIVRNFPPEAIRAYYKKWYRPDQQGIVIVGDFDVAEMEKKVIAMFSPIPMPENAAERTYPTVSDNKEPIYAFFDDPEYQMPMARLSFKSDKTPFEMRNSIQGYVGDIILPSVISRLINNRLNEYLQKPECQYAFAGVAFENYWVSKTKDAFTITAIGKNEIKKALQDAVAIVARACKTGFTDSELERVRDEMLSAAEKSYNERNNTKTEVLAKKLIRHFVDNTPNAGAEMDYQIMKQVLPSLPVQAINQVVAQLLTPENQVLVIAQPKNDSFTVVTREEILPVIENTLNAEYEAYVDEKITDPLIAKLPTPGSVKAQKAGEFGTTVFTLSNGVKVVVKPTDFKADEIRMNAFKNGGYKSYPESQAANVKLMEDAYENSKLGPFDSNTLRKYLAGKNVSLSYGIGPMTNVLSGNTTKKDLPTLMELVYATFTDLNADEANYKNMIEKNRNYIENRDKDPNQIFSNHVTAALYGNNPMFKDVDIATFEAANYNEMLAMLKESMANAADYTFIFVGNVDVETLKPLLEQYIATLPSKGKKGTVKDVTPISFASGKIKDVFKQPMAVPATMVFGVYSGTNVPYNSENSVKVSLVGNLLRTIYTNTLREEEGGTYSPYAGSTFSADRKQWGIVSQFSTNAAQQEKLITRANEEFVKLLANGTDATEFNKVKEAAIKQYENNIRENGYWLSSLYEYELGYDMISGHKAAIENLTIESLNAFMKNLYNGQNLIDVVMEGVEAK